MERSPDETQAAAVSAASAVTALIAVALLACPASRPAAVRLSVLSGTSRRRVRVNWPARARHRPRADSPRLAATWDLLAACLRAGLPVPTAIRAVIADLSGPEADALKAVAGLLALGADPAEAWAPARACTGTAQLARAAQRTARSGTALAEVAEELAGEVRSSSVDQAEARAQRAAVLIAGPLGLCFLPAFLCLGVVPVVLGLATRLSLP
ncbi:type II secretion system F family protein [Amycolatopsis taiwanensis]|uniref:type II secretion system F family protein n=1 Tax=Amycolatopsis taiwanensis TaxID=342230 RepID=UPI0004B4B83C|nr:type II secretion system F family protein [Amycolatopsis taiwanensis]